MRRILTALGSTMLFALVVVASVPALAAANTTVNITYEPGDNPYAYVPGDVSIQPGDSVTFVNPRSHGLNPAAPHPTRCHTGRSKGTCPWGSFDLDEGESHTQTFPAEGTFVYVCSVHPYMEGTVTVGDGDPSQPTPPPETEPTPEPEPEPSPVPEPEPTATTAPTASPTPAGATAPDEPESGEPTLDASVDPSPDPDSPTEDASASEAPAADDPTEAGEVATGTEVDDLAAAAERSGGTGVKVLASLLVLVTGGAVFSVRRNLGHDS